MTICDIPAVYVPTLSYELTLGTEVLHESDIQLVGVGKVLWFLPTKASNGFYPLDWGGSIVFLPRCRVLNIQKSASIRKKNARVDAKTEGEKERVILVKLFIVMYKL